MNPEKELNRIRTENSTDFFLVVSEHEFGERNQTYLYLPIFKNVGVGDICFVGFVTKVRLRKFRYQASF